MKFKSKITLFITLFASVLLIQCGSEKNESAENTEENHDEHETNEFVQLSPEELKEFEIELDTAGPDMLKLHVNLTGEIVIDPARLAHIVPRFPGIVKEVRKGIGDHVKKGEILAIIESNESLVPYEVKSLINGMVIDMHMTRGEVISDEEHAFVVADLSHVWANLSVYQKDITSVNLNQTVIISAEPKMKEAKGKITYITPVVNEKTRTATARVVLPNPDGRWKPGLFVIGKVITSEVKVPVCIPKTALETMEEQTVVFIKTDEGFKLQSVLLGRTNEKRVEILSGLEAGQEYVTKNGFTIKAELGKSAFGDEH